MAIRSFAHDPAGFGGLTVSVGPNVYIDWPGKDFTKTKLGMPSSAGSSPTHCIIHDLVVTCGATLGMDAAVFDKPVIMIGATVGKSGRTSCEPVFEI